MDSRVDDFEIVGGGSVYLLLPITGDARRWISENLGDDLVYLGRGVAVEHRYIGQIADGIISDGLTISEGVQ